VTETWDAEAWDAIWDRTKREFIECNPERHGRDDTGRCMICGLTPVIGTIFCVNHRASYDKEYGAERDRRNQGQEKYPTMYHWVISHKDFNGRDPAVHTHCAECSAPIRDMDYLCNACREQAELI
jgi:hypothetical protein